MAEEKVRSGTTTSVAAVAAYRGSSSWRLRSRTSAACSGRVSAAVSWQISSAPSACSTPLPKVWSQCSWLLTAYSTGWLLTRRRSATIAAGQVGGGLRVEDQQAGVARHDRDVDVEPGVPGDPHPIGDLLEPGHVTRA